MATQLLLRLFHFTGDDRYYQKAEKVLRSYYDAMENQPFGFAHLLCALDFYLEKPKEVVIVGEPDNVAATELLANIHSVYQPNMTIQRASASDPLEKLSPLLSGKFQVDGKPTVYVCHNFTCSAPVTTWDELRPLLEN